MAEFESEPEKRIVCRALLFRKFHLEDSVGPTVKEELADVVRVMKFNKCD